MTNNDVLRSFRYALELDNAALAGYFALGLADVSLPSLAAFLKKDDEPGFRPMDDDLLGRLFDGFVIAHRGPRSPTSESPRPAALTNNRILRAFKIALELKDTDLVGIMDLASVRVSKSELSALFRREDHRNYQPCGDQFLRNFLRGLGLWHRRGRRL